MYLYLCCVCGGSSQRLQSSVELELHLAVGCLIWVLGTKPGLLEEQQALSAGELSLQPKKESFYDKDWCATHISKGHCTWGSWASSPWLVQTQWLAALCMGLSGRPPPCRQLAVRLQSQASSEHSLRSVSLTLGWALCPPLSVVCGFAALSLTGQRKHRAQRPGTGTNVFGRSEWMVFEILCIISRLPPLASAARGLPGGLQRVSTESIN